MMMPSPTEPMTLGSPMSSPTSPGSHGQHGQVPFLPAYLMGEPTSAQSSPSSRLWASGAGSPTKASVLANKSWASPAPPPSNQASNHSMFTSPRSEQRSRDMLGTHAKEKTGAPPVHGLLESIASPAVAHGRQFDLDVSHTGSAHHLGASFTATPGGRLPHTPVLGMTSTPSVLTPGGPGHSQHFTGPKKTPPSPAQVDPFYTQGDNLQADDELDETWVTVFGFPPAATSFILQQFSQYGTILKHLIAPEGNWLHIHYQSKFQAKKALSKHGKVFGTSIMVGVSQCIDKSVMNADKENLDTSVIKTSYLGTPTGATCFQQSFCDKGNTSRSAPIRPLTAAYKAASSDHEVLHNANTPQKNANILSKAMEYMFGW